MKSIMVSVVGTTLLALFSWTAVGAHHSTIAFYDHSRWIAVEGTVEKVFFVNPHVAVHLEVINEDGEAEIWALETSHRAGLQSEAEDQWFRDTLQPGDPLVAIGWAGKRVITSMGAQGLMRPSDGWRWRWAQALEGAPEDIQSLYAD